MESNRFINKLVHKRSILCLYRDLLRLVNKLKKVDICDSALDVKNEKVKKELNYLKRDPILRKEYLIYELNYFVNHEFRKKLHTETSLIANLERGDKLQRSLSNIVQGEKHYMENLLELIIDHRAMNFRVMKWKSQYMENKEEIENVILKSRPSIIGKRAESKQIRLNNSKLVQTETNSKRLKTLKQANKYSKKNSNNIVRLYLKELQMSRRVSNPFLLPYTPDVHLNDKTEVCRASVSLPNSTKFKVLKEAYDIDYINSILKPSIEFDINRNHFLQDLHDIVNNRGPYKVQINLTQAGPTPIPYIRMPYRTDKILKEVALDIKKMMRLTRLISVWKSSSGDSNITEPKLKDGSYAVRGSKGFTVEERIFPCNYYMNLAENEALWETLLDANKTQSSTKDLESLYKENVESWSQDLNQCTRSLDNELDFYFQKYKKLRSNSSPLLTVQKKLQEKMGIHYDRQAKKYKNISSKINKGELFKHSELVNSDLVDKKYTDYLPKYLNPDWLSEKGLPEIERLGMGKKLGDYLDDNHYHNFKLGQNYNKKIKYLI